MVNRRNHFRKGLHPIYMRHYDALCGLLDEHWQPISGLRTFDHQARLYALGRTSPGQIVTKAMPGFSFHNYGLASDWSFFDGENYVNLHFDDPRWSEYIDAINKVGLKCLEWEKPHNQLVLRHAARDLFAAYTRGGMNEVDKMIREDLQ